MSASSPRPPVPARRSGLSRRRRAGFLVAALLLSLTLAFAAGELVLRAIFPGGGRQIMGAPGGEFEYTYRDAAIESRAPATSGAKQPDRIRLALLGDSITYGVGVRDWQDAYPARLLRNLNADGERYELDAFAYPGKNIDGHVRTMRAISETHDPDLVLYQWYVNDLEIGVQHQPVRRWWQRWHGHEHLRRASFLYFFLDDRLSRALPGEGPGYQAHLVATYGPNTEGWARFRHQFHRWALDATRGSRRALVWLYPQVPVSGTPVLAPIHEAMRDLGSTATTLPCPAALWTRSDGTWEDGHEAGLQRVWRWTGDGETALVSPEIPLAPGRYDVRLRLRLDDPAGDAYRVRTIVNGEERRPFEWPLDYMRPEGRWWTQHLPLEIGGTAEARVRWEIVLPRGAVFSLADLRVPLRYPKLTVMDLTSDLTGFDTHVSLFDAHPNARAHEVIARRLAGWVREARPAPAVSAGAHGNPLH